MHHAAMTDIAENSVLRSGENSVQYNPQQADTRAIPPDTDSDVPYCPDNTDSTE